jgi:hypothetical protein
MVPPECSLLSLSGGNGKGAESCISRRKISGSSHRRGDITAPCLKYGHGQKNKTLSVPKQPSLEEHEMNVLKNFEALFIAVVGLACAANYVLDSTAADQAKPATAAAAIAPLTTTPGMQVVVISAKRMSSAEKAASLAEERKGVQKT